MNRWIRNTLMFASVTGALALVPAAVVFAHDPQAPQHGPSKGHHHEGGLLEAALGLGSLTADQRSSIEQLIQQRKTAGGPVRQADAQLLTLLAQQVEQAKIDPQALAPSLGAEQAAAGARAVVDRDTLNKLHAVLSPAQRGELAATVEAGHPRGDHAGGAAHDHLGHGLDLTPEQRAQIRATLGAQGTGDAAARATPVHFLEAFRGDAFDAATFVHPRGPGEHMEKLAAAMVPVLSPSQRATLAGQLRARASHDQKGV